MAIQAELKKEIEELPSEFQEKLLKLVYLLKREFFVVTKREKKREALLEVDNFAIETGIDDLASEHDHYIYGVPKKRSSYLLILLLGWLWLANLTTSMKELN